MRVLELTLTGAKQQVTTARIMTPFLLFANNDAANAFTYGDNNVTATRGIVVAKQTASQPITRADNNINLSQYYVIGTSGSKAEVLYE